MRFLFIIILILTGINFSNEGKILKSIYQSHSESNIFVIRERSRFSYFLVLERAILEEKGQKRETMRL